MVRLIYALLEHNIKLLHNNKEDTLSGGPIVFVNKCEAQNESSVNEHDNFDVCQAGQTTSWCTAESKNKDMEIPTRSYFVLCESCYWGATFFNSSTNSVIKCPYCNGRLDTIPISPNEVYNFGYDPRRGVTMEFSIGTDIKK
jgi:hypothetical protein